MAAQHTSDSGLIQRPDELTIRDPRVLSKLFDPARYRVFRSLQTPRSVPQIAEHLGVPANGLYYHVRQLLDAGLIVQVNSRISGNHTERVYAHAAERMKLGGEIRMEEAASSIAVVLEEAFQEVSRALHSHEAGEFGDNPAGMFAWHTGALSEEKAQAFERRFEALVAEFAQAERASAGSETVRRHAMLGVFSPLPDREEGGST